MIKDSFYLSENYNYFISPIQLYQSSKWMSTIIQGLSKTPTSLVLDLKCKLLDVQCCDWSSLLFVWHCILIGAITWPLDSLNLVLTRLLQEWEDELHLKDCAKDSPPVWLMVIWSLLISELGKRNSRIWSLCFYWLLFLVPSVLCARS